MALTWTLEAPEPGRRAEPAPWYTTIGPVRLEVAEDADGAWCALLRYPLAGREEALEGRAWPTWPEAGAGSRTWARETLERWRDLGELARVALRAWDGEL
jgi:hypothetical protein